MMPAIYQANDVNTRRKLAAVKSYLLRLFSFYRPCEEDIYFKIVCIVQIQSCRSAFLMSILKGHLYPTTKLSNTKASLCELRCSKACPSPGKSKPISGRDIYSTGGESRSFNREDIKGYALLNCALKFSFTALE